MNKEKGKTFEASSVRYIKHTIRFLSLLRTWKLGKNYSKFKTFFILLNMAVLLISNLLLGLSELVKLPSGGGLSSAVSLFGPFWLHFLGFQKWFYLMWKIQDVAELVKELEECYNLSSSINDLSANPLKWWEEMNRAKKNCIRFFYVWNAFVMYGGVHWCMNPIFVELILKKINATLISNERPLPFDTWVPWDITGSLGYGYAYTIQFFGNIASCTGVILYDVFYVALLMIICAHLKYLNYFLCDRNYPMGDSFENHRKPTARSLANKLKRAKAYHVAILRFLEKLEKLTSPLMFYQCIGAISIICLISFELTTTKLNADPENIVKIVSMIEYIVGALLELFVFSYYATKVHTLGLEVGDSAFNCGWEALKIDKNHPLDEEELKRDKQSATFLTQEIITRSEKPILLTGGCFYVLSLETFRAVVSTAFSYSAMLRNLDEDE